MLHTSMQFVFNSLRIHIYIFLYFAKEQEKQCNFNSGLLRMLDETSVYSKDEVREESRPAWERHTGDDCGGVQELNGTWRLQGLLI